MKPSFIDTYITAENMVLRIGIISENQLCYLLPLRLLYKFQKVGEWYIRAFFLPFLANN